MSRSLCLMILCVACGACLDNKSVGSDLKANILKAKPAEWKDALKRNTGERMEIARCLMEIGLDKKAKGDDRIEAILLLSEVRAPEVVDYLLRNIAVEVEKTRIAGDDDAEKERPFAYALKEMGWNIVPRVLAYLENKHNDEELARLSYVLRRVCGRSTAIGLLNSQKQGAVPAMRDNLDKIIATLTRDKG